MNGKATIHDIAKACGVSSATVSRVLSGSSYPVKEITKNDILSKAHELRYIPNAVGQSLKSQRTRDVGVVIPNLTNPYYAVILQGIYDSLILEGYTPILLNSNRSVKIEEANLLTLMKKQVCAMILVGLNPDSEALREVLHYGFPIVAMEQQLDARCDRVDFDFYKGARLAAQCLADHGHRRIGYIGAPIDMSSRRLMLDGFLSCLRENSITPEEEHILISEDESDRGSVFEVSNAKKLTKKLMMMGKERPTGIVCVNDMTALAVVRELLQNGIKVPDDISIVGFDNIPYASLTTPALTTIDQCCYEMGETVSQILVERLQNPNKPFKTVMLEPTLVLRETVKRI